MSQLTDNLSAIASIKSDIRAAIESKGVSMAGVSFGSYADKIGEITTTFVTESLTVTNNGTYTPSQGVDGYSQVTVNVPQSVTGYTEKNITEGVQITSLNNSASYVEQYTFYNKTALVGANLPNCTVVRSSAFQNCTNLSVVSLPVCSLVNTLAFNNTGIRSLYLPECTYINSQAFRYCMSLTEVNLPELTSISSSVFMDCRSLVSANLGGIKSTTVGLFSSCYMLQDVTLPNLEYIEQYTFAICRSLPSASYSRVSYIGSNAFWLCYTLSSISFPECYYVSDSAFRECSSLENIDFPKCRHIGQYTFNSTKFTTINLPYVSFIGYWAFYSSPSRVWSDINLPYLSSQGGNPLQGVVGVTKINIPIYSNRVWNAGYFGWNLSVISEISIGNKFYLVPSYSNNLGLSSINTANCSIYVDAAMYDKWVSATGWSSLSAAFVSEGDPTIPMLSYSDNVLYGKTEVLYSYWYTSSSGINVNMSSVNEVSLPNCRVIAQGAFSGVSRMTTVNLPNCSVVESNAFRGCFSLSTLKIPKCRYIYNGAFYDCTRLQYIILSEDNVCYLESAGAFWPASIPCSVYVPSSLVDAYKSAWNWSQISSRIFPMVPGMEYFD